MSKISTSDVPTFDFNQKPIMQIQLEAKDLLGAYILSLQGDRSALVDIEALFYEAAYFNAVLFDGRKIVSKIQRTGQVATNILHLAIGQLTRLPVTKVVFAAYDAPEFQCNQSQHKKGDVDNE